MLRERGGYQRDAGSLRDRLSRYNEAVQDGFLHNIPLTQFERKHSELRNNVKFRRAFPTKSGYQQKVLPVNNRKESETDETQKFNPSDNYKLRCAAIDSLLERGIMCKSLPANRNDRRWFHIIRACDLSEQQVLLMQEMAELNSKLS